MKISPEFRVKVEIKQALAMLHYYAKALGMKTEDAAVEIAERIRDRSNSYLQAEKKGIKTHGIKTIEQSWVITRKGEKMRSRKVILKNESPYAPFVEYGTGVHPPGGRGKIRPKQHRVMKFEWYPGLDPELKGKDGYVYLPYMRGQPPLAYFQRGRDDVMKEVKYIAETYIKEILL